MSATTQKDYGPFVFRAERDVLEELRHRAELEDRTLAAEIRRALRAWVRSNDSEDRALS